MKRKTKKKTSVKTTEARLTSKHAKKKKSSQFEKETQPIHASGEASSLKQDGYTLGKRES